MRRHPPPVLLHTANGSLCPLPDLYPASASAPANPTSRRTRSATALKQITSLQDRRNQPDGQAKRNPSGGFKIRQVSHDYNAANSEAHAAASGAGEARPAGQRFAKLSARPTTTHGAAPPEGQMARAPSTLKLSRNATVGSMRGPNLGGRSAGRGGPRGDKGSGGRDRAPKKREKKDSDAGPKQSTSFDDIDASQTLSDGMVQHLLRLQRKEWDRVPYVPKYATGSFAARELIHEGRELFRGEAPPVKYWGKLEKTIGVVGMFGAEAHLKVRRVPDGDEAPFGQEEAGNLEAEATDKREQEAIVQ
jgi:hypothetical protein